MKTVCKKLLCLMLVAMLLVSAVPAAFASETCSIQVELIYEANDGSESRTGLKDVTITKGASYNVSELANKVDSDYSSIKLYNVGGVRGDKDEVVTPNEGDVCYIRVRVATLPENGNDDDSQDNQAPTCDHAADKCTTVNTATCFAAGKKTVTCECGHVVSSEDVAATGNHTWNAGEVTKVANCTEDGVKTFTCTVTGCGTTKTEKIDNLGGHLLANDKCMNRFSDGTRCDYVRETTPNPTPAAGDLTVYAYVKTEDTDYVNFNGGRPIVLEGKADATRDKALAEAVIGKQLIDFRWMGYEKDDNGNATVNLNATILEGTNGRNVYKLRVYTNDATSNYKQIDIYEGEGILAAIKNAGITPKYKDHVLVGYLNHMNGNSSSYLTIYDVADGDDADSNGVIKVWADWREKTDDDDEDYEYGEGGGLYGDDNEDPIYDVVLYIYTNGKTSSYAKKVSASSMGKHTKDGVLSRDEVELVVQKYFKTNEDTKYYGLFTKYYWNDGEYLTANAKYSIELDPDETNYVYVMVKDAKAYVADSSNPKTGDNIMIAVTTMGLAAAALVTVNELKKRKMI